MTDATLQAIRRAHLAAPDSVEAHAAYLRAALRAGLLSQERVELAAYCGHEAAQQACGRTLGEVLMDVFPENTEARRDADEWGSTVMAFLSPKPLDTMPLNVLVSGLSRWGPEALTRAAAAAGWEALAKLPPLQLLAEGWHDPRILPRRALKAAEAWLACPCAEHGDAWSYTFATDLPTWVPISTMALAPSSRTHDPPIGPADCVVHSARLAGEQPVRTAIQSALISWALRGL